MNRRWFQIHLSSAIVAVLTVGGIVTLGIRSTCSAPPVEGAVPYQCVEYGWPKAFYFGDVLTFDWTSESWGIADPIFGRADEHIEISSLAIDAAVLVLLSVLYAGLFEFAIRRVESTKSNSGNVKQVVVLMLAIVVVLGGVLVVKQFQRSSWASYDARLKNCKP